MSKSKRDPLDVASGKSRDSTEGNVLRHAVDGDSFPFFFSDLRLISGFHLHSWTLPTTITLLHGHETSKMS